MDAKTLAIGFLKVSVKDDLRMDELIEQSASLHQDYIMEYWFQNGYDPDADMDDKDYATCKQAAILVRKHAKAYRKELMKLNQKFWNRRDIF